MANEKNPKWKGGHSSAHCRCVRALCESRKAAKARGYAPCNATVEFLIPTVADSCQLCGVPESELSKRLCLDHDHVTGAFRGWLCDRCNRLVGMVETHQNAVAAYLAKAGRHDSGKTIDSNSDDEEATSDAPL